tara:strand:+ start:1002 stop:1223 length:222 start_codon:yes stop_codon:yes gene_type:complete
MHNTELPYHQQIEEDARRRGVSYTRIIAERHGLVSKGKKSKTMKGKMDFTTKKGMVRDVGGKRKKGRKAYSKK